MTPSAEVASAHGQTTSSRVGNIGEAGAGASKTKVVLDGTTVLATIDTPMLAIGGSVEVTLQWDAKALSGQHSITVTADDVNQVDESNESNNTLAVQYNLGIQKASVDEAARKGRLVHCNKSRNGLDHKLEPGTIAAYAPPMTEADGDSTQTSRSRLLSVAKSLFGQNGYDQTSTSAIARAAGTSESQLMRYFGGKAGLLEAIFNDAWTGLAGSVAKIVSEAPHAREATLRLLVMMMTALGRDHDIAVLFLLEGRRMRGATHEVFLSQGFVQFFKILCDLIDKVGMRWGHISTRRVLPCT